MPLCLHCMVELDETDVEQTVSDAQLVCSGCGARGPLVTIGCRDPDEDGPIDLVREALQLHSESQALRRIQLLTAELEEVKRGYVLLDTHWSNVHQAFTSAIRGALGMKDASVGELVAAIEGLKRNHEELGGGDD